MIQEQFSTLKRENKHLKLNADLVIVGGGLAGVCAAIVAARNNTKTILVQDRPVLGGNASSEVRLWALGATSHMGNNNRWSREGGVIDEILTENLHRNKEGNPVIFDTILLDKVLAEDNISLLLNTAVYEVEKSGEKRIKKLKAYNPQNATFYELNAPLFCDASGDGIVAFQSGAAFRIGAESKEEFGELFAPDKAYGELLGHSMYFYSKRASHPVKYKAPDFALKDIKEIPRYKVIDKEDSGCRFWWLEFGGRLDTIHDTEEIKYELWKVVYGVWDYIKNSGEFDDVDNLTLEWAANIPGKRESRRFEGHYMMKQQDVIEQSNFDDAIAFGGWAIDLHPADGVYSELSGCTQWHSKGTYDIPYRSLVSKDIDNLFLGGRIISASHVAFGSTRVMATTGFTAQAIGMAAALCTEERIQPADLLENGQIKELQNRLNLEGQSIRNLPIDSKSNEVTNGKVTATSSLKLNNLKESGDWLSLETSVAQLLPLKQDTQYSFGINVKASEDTTLEVQLRTSRKAYNYTPDMTLEVLQFEVKKGVQELEIKFGEKLQNDQYAFVTFMANNKLELAESDHRVSGIMSVFNGENKAVSNKGKQVPPANLGVEEFEFWIPYRRPGGKNLAISIQPAVNTFDESNIGNGFVRPWLRNNCWIAELEDKKPQLKIEWKKARDISKIRLFFDPDYDHALESVQYGHPEEVVPFMVQNYRILTLDGKCLYECKDNYQAINTIKLDTAVNTIGIIIEAEHPSKDTPASIFEVLI